ncbi:GNAT family N-acetyltransferase [Azospirillum soli]|uniref:GNAT family N-acetyltransferase n=1 Tax=Azospirillum soli TaxID=1304799 RepID=UPI001AE4160F|nr:GNAT family protein [Azospirillum soli]MBP2316254.1 RimJ/RimL family protein N-acetyltransferase [Azospirillum soli]
MATLSDKAAATEDSPGGMPQRSLETPDFLLAPFQDGDISDEYVAWMNDPEVVQYTDSRYVQQTRETIGAFLRSFDGRNAMIWRIIHKPDGVYIGNCLLRVNWLHKVAELGGMVGDRRYWGKPVIAQTFERLIRHAFQDLGMEKVTGGTRSCNYPAVYNLHRIGMTLEAELRRHAVQDGRRVDIALFALFREDWEARQSA